MVFQYLPFLCRNFFLQTGNLSSEDLPLILQLAIRLLQLDISILKKHFHASHFFLKLLPHLDCLIHGLLHRLLLCCCDGVESLELVLDGLQVADCLIVVRDAGCLCFYLFLVVG